MGVGCFLVCYLIVFLVIIVVCVFIMFCECLLNGLCLIISSLLIMCVFLGFGYSFFCRDVGYFVVVFVGV